MLAPGAPSAEAPLLFAAGVFRAQAEMTRAVYLGLNQLHKALAAIAGQAAAEELAEAGPQLHAVADQPMTDEQYADIKWRQAHPGAVGS